VTVDLAGLLADQKKKESWDWPGPGLGSVVQILLL
jgi:hypothetical protein